MSETPTTTGRRVIKRYPNRKLYDTERSCYVTLDEIAAMVKEGQDVQIIDNKSNEDITSVTLTQIIYEEEKKNKSILPLSALRNIIQSGQEYIQSRFTESAERMNQLRDETEKNIQKILSRGEMTAEETKNALADFFLTRQQRFEEFQKNLDERIRHYVERLTGRSAEKPEESGKTANGESMHGEIHRLRARIEELEKLVEDLSGEK